MASFRIQPEQAEKPSNKLKMQGASRSHMLNNWLEFWKMFKNFNPATIKENAERYAGKDRLKMYKEILGK